MGSRLGSAMWELVPRPDGVEVRLFGVVTARDLEAAHRAAYFVTPNERHAFVVFDLSRVSEFRVTTEEVQRITNAGGVRLPQCADLYEVVVAPRLAHYFVARQWWREGGAVPSVVVRTRDAASKWIAQRQLVPA